MSMINDMSWGSEDNEQECNANADLVSIHARRFPPGRWSSLGPGSEKKWHSFTHVNRPQVEWDRVAELMVIKFGVSGHPVFRATSPLSRETLKSKGGWTLSIHFCADGETIETFFRTIISVNQLSIYGPVSDLCDEYRICQARTGDLSWQNNLTHCFSQQVCWWKHVHFRPKIPHRKIYCKNTKNEWKDSHDKMVWLKFVLMRTGFLTTVEVGQYFTKDTEEFSQFTEPVAFREYTLPRDEKSIWPRKVGFEGISNLGPCWKSQPATCKVNVEWKLELNLWTKTILNRGSDFLMAWISW